MKNKEHNENERKEQIEETSILKVSDETLGTVAGGNSPFDNFPRVEVEPISDDLRNLS